jgi:hypothetical protein
MRFRSVTALTSEGRTSSGKLISYDVAAVPMYVCRQLEIRSQHSYATLGREVETFSNRTVQSALKSFIQPLRKFACLTFLISCILCMCVCKSDGFKLYNCHRKQQNIIYLTSWIFTAIMKLLILYLFVLRISKYILNSATDFNWTWTFIVVFINLPLDPISCKFNHFTSSTPIYRSSLLIFFFHLCLGFNVPLSWGFPTETWIMYLFLSS